MNELEPNWKVKLSEEPKNSVNFLLIKVYFEAMSSNTYISNIFSYAYIYGRHRLPVSALIILVIREEMSS